MKPTNPRHPDQPFVMVEGRQRFKANPLIRLLVDAYPNRMNGIFQHFRDEGVAQEDIDQFYQLIGYSWGGYNELHMVTDETKDRLNPIAEAHYEATKDPAPPPATFPTVWDRINEE